MVAFYLRGHIQHVDLNMSTSTCEHGYQSSHTKGSLRVFKTGTHLNEAEEKCIDVRIMKLPTA